MKPSLITIYHEGRNYGRSSYDHFITWYWRSYLDEKFKYENYRYTGMAFLDEIDYYVNGRKFTSHSEAKKYAKKIGFPFVQSIPRGGRVL